jgi:hypothetical protein
MGQFLALLLDAALLGLLVWVAWTVLKVGAVGLGLFVCCVFGRRIGGAR